MPHTVLRNAPDGGDLVPVSLHRKDRARLDRLPVDVDRAGPATGRVAPRMHAPDPKVLPEMMEQERLGSTSATWALPSTVIWILRNPLSFPESGLSACTTCRNSRSTGSPQAAFNVFTIAAFTPDIQRCCSPCPFLVGSARSLARRLFSCISRVLSAYLS